MPRCRLHELTYVLPRTRPKTFRAREDVFRYLTRLLVLDGVRAHDKESLIRSLQRWVERGVTFGDARLMVMADQRGG